MRLALFFAAALVGGVLLYFSFSHPYQEAYTPDNLIRLHVVAHSDRPADQAVKHEVRDVLLEELGPEFGKAKNAAQAEAIVRERREDLEARANSRLALAGVPYRARIEIGDFVFPTRSYYDLVLPAGRYRAVKVVLGEGAGENWWCVLFPPLCFVDLASSGGPALAQEAMAALADNKPQTTPPLATRLRLLEIIRHSQRELARLRPAFPNGT